MNGRPKTTQFSVILRRPLLWAALCSMVLHLPVLALLSLKMPHVPQADNAMLLSLLSVDADAKQGSGNDQSSRIDQDTEIDLNADNEQAPATAQQPLTESESEAMPEQIARARFIDPASGVTLSPDTTRAADNSESASAAVDVPEPLQVPVTLAADFGTSLPSPTEVTPLQPLPMAEPDVSQMKAAMQNMLDQLNHSGPESALLSLQHIAPASLGLPATDQVTAVALPVTALTGLQQVDVTVTREIDGRLFRMRARLQERALSHYAKFVNRWDDNVMLSNDLVEGRFHANSEVNFEVAAHARPQFTGEVTIAGRQPVANRLRRSTMFADGIRTGTGRIAVPRDSLPAHWLDTAATVLELESDARLEFLGRDGVLWTDMARSQKTLLPVPEGGLVIVADGRKRIELSGTVSGQVLVYSPHQLLITGNLVYADNTPASADTLALISDGSIEIAPASVTGAGDLQIHGALFARQRFSVRRFRDRHQGTLYVYGSLVAGSVSATEPRFYTHIRYDQRFDHNRPPAFPSAGMFDLLPWDQHWRAVNDADALIADVADNARIQEP